MLKPPEHPTSFPELNGVLGKFALGVAEILDANLIGVYLAGSFAAGDADAFSDADVIVITENDISESQLAELQVLHGRIYELDSAWAQHLEISYFPRTLLNNREAVGVTKLWYLDNGQRSLKPDTHDNTWVVRWVLREYGIALSGPPTRGLINPIPADLMRAELTGIMRSWGGELIAKPEIMGARWYQAFVVVTWCRILMTLKTGRIYSKPASAEWALRALDQRWSALIQKSLDERRLPWEIKVLESAKSEDLQETREFTRYVLARIEM